MSNQAVKKPASQATVGKIIDKIFDLRKKKTELESALKDVGGQIDDLESEVMEMLESTGVEKTSKSAWAASPKSSVCAVVRVRVRWCAWSADGEVGCTERAAIGRA